MEHSCWYHGEWVGEVTLIVKRYAESGVHQIFGRKVLMTVGVFFTSFGNYHILAALLFCFLRCGVPNVYYRGVRVFVFVAVVGLRFSWLIADLLRCAFFFSLCFVFSSSVVGFHSFFTCRTKLYFGSLPGPLACVRHNLKINHKLGERGRTAMHYYLLLYSLYINF
ncbi:unnamed protein product [Laminaria digitata]